MTERLRRLGAARRRAADPRRARSLRGRADRRGGDGRAERHHARRGDHPRLRQRALAPRVRGLRGLRRRRRRSGRGSGHTSSARPPRVRRHGRDRTPRRRRLARGRASRRRPTTASRARLRSRPPSSGCGRSSTSRCSRASPQTPSGGSTRSALVVERRSSSGSASRRTPRTRAPLDVVPWCLSLGIPVGTHLAESASENEWLERRQRPARGGSPILVPPTGKRAVATLEPVLGPDLLCAHCVDVSSRGDRAARRREACRSRTARGRTRCSAAASRRWRRCGPQASSVGLGTDSPASAPSFDIFEELRTADLVRARALERRPDALLAADVAAARHDRCRPRSATRRPGGYPDRPGSAPT